jgi:hypothetical protein
MHLGGMLDGQARFSKMAIPAQEAAAFAYQSDPMCVSTVTQACNILCWISALLALSYAVAG